MPLSPYLLALALSGSLFESTSMRFFTFEPVDHLYLFCAVEEIFLALLTGYVTLLVAGIQYQTIAVGGTKVLFEAPCVVKKVQ